jgi:hypothetical protein
MIHTILTGLTTLFAALTLATGWRDRRLRMTIPQMYRDVQDRGVPQYRRSSLSYVFTVAFLVFLLLTFLV